MKTVDLIHAAQIADRAKYPTEIVIVEKGLCVLSHGPGRPGKPVFAQHIIDWAVLDAAASVAGLVHDAVDACVENIDGLMCGWE